jgi:ZIP family zinc transporter
VVGAVVDGVPESLIFGIQVASGQPTSTAFLVAVVVSNVPRALVPSADLAGSGWKAMRMTVMWGSVVVACGVASALGFAVTDAFGAGGDRAAAFAAGGLLAMLTDPLMPLALEPGGPGRASGRSSGSRPRSR